MTVTEEDEGVTDETLAVGPEFSINLLNKTKVELDLSLNSSKEL